MSTRKAYPSDLSDAQWAILEPLMPAQKPTGPRLRVDRREVVNAIGYVLRTGCHWKAVPAEYGSGSTCHRRFQQWVADGTWDRLWRDQLERYDREHGIGWDWQSADSATVPSPPRRGRHGAGPDQPAEIGHQAAPRDRPAGRPTERGHQRGQPDRHESGRGDPRWDRRPAA